MPDYSVPQSLAVFGAAAFAPKTDAGPPSAPAKPLFQLAPMLIAAAVAYGALRALQGRRRLAPELGGRPSGSP